MDITQAILTVSLILNFAFIIGIPATMFVRFLIKRTKTWLIGIGPQGIDLRQARVKNNKYVWIDGDRHADVHLDTRLMRSSTTGQPVAFVDTEMMQHIAPRGKERGATTAARLAQLIPYDGTCAEDEHDHVTVTRRDGSTVGVVSNVWERISGWRLNAIRRRTNIEKMNTPDVGMWAALQKIGPLVSILAVVLILGLFMVVT